MIRKLKQILAVSLVFAGLSIAVVSLPVAAAGTFQSAACAGVNQVGDNGCDNDPGGTINNLFASALNILSLIAGFAGVLMIIISGFKFITAQGDSSAIASARQTLIYALVGLVVAILAQVIVHFVLGKVAGVK
jgi:hypothetical protein